MLHVLRVLHVMDHAGVSGLLAKHQNVLGCDAKVIVRNGYDNNGQQKFYGDRFFGPKRHLFSRCGLFRFPLRLVWRTLSVFYFYLYVAFMVGNLI